MAKETVTTESIRQDLQNVGSIITAARGLIKQGQGINLEPLEHEVERLCEQIIKLPGEENAPLRPLMMGLIDELNKLASEMRGHHAQLQDQLHELTAREKASTAYVTPNQRRPSRR